MSDTYTLDKRLCSGLTATNELSKAIRRLSTRKEIPTNWTLAIEEIANALRNEISSDIIKRMSKPTKSRQNAKV